MDNLDEFMQRKFEQEDPAARFEFQESYWEQAKLLLEAAEQEQRKKRRGLLWLWLVGICLLLCGWGFWQTGVELFRSPAARAQEPVAFHQPKDALNSLKDVSKTRWEKLADEAILAVPENAAVLSQSINGSKMPIASNEDRRDPMPFAALSLNSLNKRETGDRAASLSKPNDAERELLFNKRQSGAKEASMNFEPAISTEGTLPAGLVDAEAMDEKKRSEPALPLLLGKILKPESSNRLINLPQALVSQANKMAPVRVILGKNQRILEGGIVLYPGARFNSHFGMRVALLKHAPVLPHLELAYGIGYRYQPAMNESVEKLNGVSASNFDSYYISVKSSVRYSFGYNEKEIAVRPLGIHWIETPISMQYQNGRFSLNAGVLAGLILARQESVVTNSSGSLNSTQSELRRRFRLGKPIAYRGLSRSAFAMAAYALPGGMNVYIRPTYCFNDPLKTTSGETTYPGYWSVDAGVRIRF